MFLTHLLIILLSFFHHHHRGTWNVPQIPPVFLLSAHLGHLPTWSPARNEIKMQLCLRAILRGSNQPHGSIQPPVISSSTLENGQLSLSLVNFPGSSTSQLTNPSICLLFFSHSKGSRKLINQKSQVNEK